MPTLYDLALRAMTDAELAGWNTAKAQILSVSDYPGSGNGASIMALLQRECHLSEDASRDDPTLMREFLVALSTELRGVTGNDIVAKFDATAAQFSLKGKPISRTPQQVYRYCNGPGLFRQVAERLLGVDKDMSEMLESLYADASRSGNWSAVERFVTRGSVWDIIPRASVQLSWRESTFVTFDIDATIRTSRRLIHSALALSPPVNDCFIEVTYPMQPTISLHIPTVADAGWFQYFQPQPVGQPCGWTKPHPCNPPLSPQPEAVQRRPTLALVDSPTNLRVRH